ncbi:MAG: hypothetical protein K9N10_19475 [Deltaproteobacteria bacterium]|nr:hypothetical protein [Deltaproteobacteria bacterium]
MPPIPAGNHTPGHRPPGRYGVHCSIHSRSERFSQVDKSHAIALGSLFIYKDSYGAESIVPGYGTVRENEAVIYRFTNLLGTPNVLTAGHFCYGPRIATTIITCGTNPIVDYENNPRCIMVWGNNVVISNPKCVWDAIL